MKVLRNSIQKYMDNYNQKRLHSAIDYQTPNAPREYFLASSRQVYFQAIHNSDSKGDKKL